MTLDYRTDLERLTDAVDALTQPRTHREGLTPDMAPLNAETRQPIHGAVITQVLSLLDQLELAVEPSGSVVAGHRIPASTPAARIDAINALLVIDTEASQFVTVHLDDDRTTLTGNLRALVGIATSLGAGEQHDLARAAVRWHTMAAIVTGWEVPPRSPHNTCPLCTVLGSLRVRVDPDKGSGTALCVECHATWDETTIGLLAEHMRAENGEEGHGAASSHRPSVLPNTKHMAWRAECRCGWESWWRWRAAALRAAEQHRELFALEVSA